MNKTLLDLLACPLCKSSLRFNEAEQLLICRAERLAFSVEEGTPVLLAEAARSLSVEETDALTEGR